MHIQCIQRANSLASQCGAITRRSHALFAVVQYVRTPACLVSLLGNNLLARRTSAAGVPTRDLHETIIAARNGLPLL